MRAPSLPPSSLRPPSLLGRRRVSAERRPGNAADAPRSIPGGGSAPVLQHGHRGFGRARSRRLAHGQGGGRVGLGGSRRLLPTARPRRAPGSSTGRGVALLSPPLGSPRFAAAETRERRWLPGSRAAQHPRPARGPGRFLCLLGARRPLAPPALRLRLQRSTPARRSFRFSSSPGCVLLTKILYCPGSRGRGELASHRLDKLRHGGVPFPSRLPVRGGAGVPPGLRGCPGEVQRYVVPRLGLQSLARTSGVTVTFA